MCLVVDRNLVSVMSDSFTNCYTLHNQIVQQILKINANGRARLSDYDFESVI